MEALMTSSNSKFNSFLVLILIQKNNADNKLLEKNFIQKK